MSEGTIEIAPPPKQFLVQPSLERPRFNVGDGQLVSHEKFLQTLRDPNVKLWFRGQKRELDEIEPKDALEAVGVWTNGDLILITKKGYTRKVPPYYNLEQFGLGPEKQVREMLESKLTAYAHVFDLEYIPENIGVRGEIYVDQGSGEFLIRAYSHEGEEWESQDDKEHTIFHEVGHGVYSQLNPEERLQWERLLTTDSALLQISQEIETDRKTENLSKQELKNEVFADSFASLATANDNQKGEYKENHLELCQLMRKYLKGF